MSDWFKSLPDKIFSAINKQIASGNSETIQLDQTKIIRAINFIFDGVANTDYENVFIKIYAGSIDKTYFNGSLTDLLLIGFLQNTRNIIDGTKVESLLTFDYVDDAVMSPLVPYIEPITITIENKTANQISLKLGLKGINSYEVIKAISDAYAKNKGVIPTDLEIKEIMKTVFKKRRFISTLHDISGSTLQISVPSTQSGVYEKIIPYEVEGNLISMSIVGVDEIVEENDFDILTSYALLEAGLDPALSPTKKLGLIENMPATNQYWLNINADPNSKLRVLTERIG